jgi:glycosyltransferase involved in cell wall biosynthesis
LAERVAAATGVTLVQREQIAFPLVDQVYTDLDLVIFCSLTEGNPYMALEAMAAGIPVLGTAVGLFPELAQTGGGLILPTEPDALVHHATALIKALQRDTRMYDLMRQAAAVEGARRDWVVLKPQWLAALAEIATPG